MREWAIAAASNAYRNTLPLAEWAFWICVLALLPLAIFRSNRRWVGTAIFWASYAVGIAAWFLGATLTLASLGWVWLVIGLIVFGLGVVPLGILGAYFSLDQTPLALALLTMTIATFAMRMLGLWLVAKSDKPVSAARAVSVDTITQTEAVNNIEAILKAAGLTDEALPATGLGDEVASNSDQESQRRNVSPNSPLGVPAPPTGKPTPKPRTMAEREQWARDCRAKFDAMTPEQRKAIEARIAEHKRRS